MKAVFLIPSRALYRDGTSVKQNSFTHSLSWSTFILSWSTFTWELSCSIKDFLVSQMYLIPLDQTPQANSIKLYNCITLQPRPKRPSLALALFGKQETILLSGYLLIASHFFNLPNHNSKAGPSKGYTPHTIIPRLMPQVKFIHGSILYTPFKLPHLPTKRLTRGSGSIMTK